MSDGETTTPTEPAQPNVDSGARYQARIALITAVVALVSALLGPLVSLKINSSQIESQGEQNKVQNAEERETSESEFVRTERRAVYADYLAAYNNGAVDLTASGGKITVGGYPDELLAKETEALIATLREVTAKYYAVSVLVSTEAKDEAATSYQLFAQQASELLNLASAALSGSVTEAELSQVHEQLGDRYAQLIGSSEQFIEKARDDLHADTKAEDPTEGD